MAETIPHYQGNREQTYNDITTTTNGPTKNFASHPPFRQRRRRRSKYRHDDANDDANDGPEASSSYDTGSQVVAHIVRDWTTLGTTIRQSLYTWCRKQVGVSPRQKVLVPGAGMGRLAFDLAVVDGHDVEANDSSLTMAAAAYHLWHNDDNSNTFVLHPFALDYFTNEANSHNRYQQVLISRPNTTAMRGSLSYSIGDFSKIYSGGESLYNAIITCFFLDTASNIYEYLAILHNNLVKGGKWINVGPLQWHRNSQLHPAIDELRELVQGMGFSVRHWSQDVEPMDYRLDPIADRKSTKFEGFRPLRIVAVKRDRGHSYPSLQKTDTQKQAPPASSSVVIEEL
eukprot:CAMPEP_0116547136 /NCGR_PEP_ID=MMETSP0397-20121206/3612_1 /TAXON_ID=216820 /ORGANISM="Cyclophora tenuis, Strain ECT3854" /LENGTH=341 /DNA_ID=CAMNT_0004071639 /DNA_START=89 /DNA_END=1114 /DNA_ORIENTATION=+